MRLALALTVALSLLAVPAGASPLPGAPNCPIFPADNVWHADISSLPVDSHSDAWIANSGGAARLLHPDFGPSFGAQPVPYGIPYAVVDASHSKVSVAFDYSDESDAGPYPFGPDTPIEGGQAADGDRHALMVDSSTCTLYELYNARYSSSGSTAGSGAIFDLKANGLRPATWTSADAAGLPILPGLLRLDEVSAGSVDHAIRFTVAHTDRSFIWPARHQAGDHSDANFPPMGARFRLKAGFDISRFRPDTQVVLRAMQRYGMVLADNGSNWYFQGTAEDGWDTDMLSELKRIPAGEFEAVDESSLMVDPNSAQVRGGTTTPPPPGPPFPGVDVPARDWFFAEGTTRPGFQEYLTIANPSLAGDSHIAVDYQFGDRPASSVDHTVTAGSRLTIDVNNEVGAGRDVSARVRVLSGPGVVVERPLYFSASPGGVTVDGGHTAAGLAAPAADWFFAEGTTRPGFQEYLTLQNPSPDAAAVVRVDFPGAAGVSLPVTVGPAARATVDVNAVVGIGADVSAVVHVVSGPGVVAERPMYFATDPGLGRTVVDGSDAAGAPGPRADWFFAEGTTRPGFQEYLTLANPSPSAPATIRVDYQGGGGAVSQLTLAPSSRSTVDVNAAVGPGRDVSAAVHVVSGPGIVAERPLYFAAAPGGLSVDGGDSALGAAGPSASFVFAEGTTRAGFQEYLTVQNPGTALSTIDVFYRVGAGQVQASATYTVAGGTRLTVDVNADAGVGKDVALVVAVASGPGVVAERPLYFSGAVNGLNVDGGSVAAG